MDEKVKATWDDPQGAPVKKSAEAPQPPSRRMTARAPEIRQTHVPPFGRSARTCRISVVSVSGPPRHRFFQGRGPWIREVRRSSSLGAQLCTVGPHGNRINATRRSELDSEPIQPNRVTIPDGCMGSKSSLERRYGASLSTHGLGNERLRVFRKGRSLRLSCLRPHGNRINTGRTLTVAPPSRSSLSDRRIGPFRTVGPAPRRRTSDGAPFSVPVSESLLRPM